MKSSNKLLIGFLIIVLALPLCFLLALKTKVSLGKYTDSRFTMPTTGFEPKNGNINPYKVIKVIGPKMNNFSISSMLTCNIYSNKEAKYNYTPFDNSLYVSKDVVGDTLFIKYNRTNDAPQNYYPLLVMNLYLPNMQDIIVENATLMIDNIDPKINPSINVRLKSNALLKLGYVADNEMNSTPSQTLIDTSADEARRFAATLHIDSINITATSSQIFIGSSTIKHLKLNISHTSSLNIPYRFNVDKISGEISADASIKGNFKALEALQPLLK